MSHSDSEGYDGKDQSISSNGESLYEDRRDSDLEAAVGSRGNATV